MLAVAGSRESALHGEAVPILCEVIAKVEANVIDDEFSRIYDVLIVGKDTHSGELVMFGNGMKEDLVAAVIGVEL
jgi:hypothetical protein